MTTRRMLVAVAAGLVLAAPKLAKAEYKFTTIDMPGGIGTIANANSQYKIAGEFDDVDGSTHGFVLSCRGFTQIDVPHAVYTSVNGINDNGQLAGTYQDATRLHAYFWDWDKRVFIKLDPRGSTESQGGFINARGEVVGGYRDEKGIRHAFIWRKGVFTTIDPPNGHPTLGPIAFGINDVGQVVGTYVDKESNRHGFLRNKGNYTRLDVPGAVLTVAEGINNAGQIVGLYVDANGNEHGFVLNKGVYTTIDIPHSTATAVYSINARGEIVGEYVDADDVTHGYVGKPSRGCPERN